MGFFNLLLYFVVDEGCLELGFEFIEIEVNLLNNYFGYVIIWFGLVSVLLVVYVGYYVSEGCLVFCVCF